MKYICDEGVENLRAAICVRAALDYQDALKKLNNPKKKLSKKDRDLKKREARRLRKFFKSDWYYMLMPGVDGSVVLKEIEGGKAAI